MSGNQSQTNFDIYERIRELETKMDSLMGNGRPGRIDKIETILSSLQRYLWTAIGVLAAVQFLAANGVLDIRHLFNK